MVDVLERAGLQAERTRQVGAAATGDGPLLVAGDQVNAVDAERRFGDGGEAAGCDLEPDGAAAPVLGTGQDEFGDGVQASASSGEGGRIVVHSSSASCSTHSRAGPSEANNAAIATSSSSRRSTRMPVAPHSVA